MDNRESNVKSFSKQKERESNLPAVFYLKQTVKANKMVTYKVYGPYTAVEKESIQDGILSTLTYNLEQARGLIDLLLGGDIWSNIYNIANLRGTGNNPLPIIKGYSQVVDVREKLEIMVPSLMFVNPNAPVEQLKCQLKMYKQELNAMARYTNKDMLELIDCAWTTAKELTDVSIPIIHTIEFDAEDLEDIMCSALEGGIGYWAKIKDVDTSSVEHPTEYLSEVVPQGGRLHIVDAEDDTNDCGWFDMKNLIKGLTMYYNQTGHCLTPVDIEDIDADHADVIFQLGLFEEIIYG